MTNKETGNGNGNGKSKSKSKGKGKGRSRSPSGMTNIKQAKAETTAGAKTTAKANTGILRYAQNDNLWVGVRTGWHDIYAVNFRDRTLGVVGYGGVLGRGGGGHEHPEGVDAKRSAKGNLDEREAGNDDCSDPAPGLAHQQRDAREQREQRTDYTEHENHRCEADEHGNNGGYVLQWIIVHEVQVLDKTLEEQGRNDSREYA
jgi:hypothetical protein